MPTDHDSGSPAKIWADRQDAERKTRAEVLATLPGRHEDLRVAHVALHKVTERHLEAVYRLTGAQSLKDQLVWVRKAVAAL